MGSVERAARVVMLSCAVLTGAVGTARANEIWVAPTLQQDLGGFGIAANGVWPATPVGAVRLAWGVPGDLQSFTGARLVLIPHPPAGAATLTVYVCAAKSGDMSTAACTGPFTQPFTGVANQLIEVDVSAAIAPQVGLPGANHLAVVAFTTPTTGTDHIVGLRFGYDPTTPAGVATLGANTFTGAQSAPAFIGDGSGLTNVPLPGGAATLGANTFSGTQTAPAFVGNGSGLTNLPFPAGAATLGANTFAGTQTIDGANLDLDTSTSTTGNILKDGTRFLHTAGGDTNLFLGVSAGNLAFSTTSLPVRNTGIGHLALSGNRFGGNNTAVGANALRDNNSTNLGGVHNTAVGAEAMKLNTSGSQNTAFGTGALVNNTSGGNNVSIGFASMVASSTGDRNTALGFNGLAVLGDGSDNLGVGYQAGFNLNTGSNNVYIDNRGAAIESETIRIGDTQTRTFIAGVRGIAPANADALPVVIDSMGQLGTVSPTGIATLSANTFAGNQSVDGGNLDLDPATATTGAITKNGGRFLHDFGVRNVFIGADAGNFTMAPAANDNIGVGAGALASVTTGSNNVAVGTNVLASNLTGAGNTGVGEVALFSNTTGIFNTAVGGNALQDNIDGSRDAAFGASALRFNTSGSFNTAAGVSALHFNTTGNRNTAVGDDALRNNTTGSRNVAVGWNAGLNATTGVHNIYLGNDVVGEAGESNAMYLGRTGNQTKTVIAGVRDTTVAGGEMVLIDAAGRLGSGPVATGPDTVGTGEVIDGSLAPADVAFNYAASASKGGPATDVACTACVAAGEVSFSFAGPGANTFTGTQTINAGNLDLDPSTAATGTVLKNGQRFLHNFNSGTFVGVLAGNFTMTGAGNTGMGFATLSANTTGAGSTAMGSAALDANTTGDANTAMGTSALGGNTSGGSNTAIGNASLANNTQGHRNTAGGFAALVNNSIGADNVAVGYNAGANQTTGSGNIYLGANVQGVAGEVSTMYLGRVGTQIKTVIAGVRGIPTGIANAVPVQIDSLGQLGTINSSRRFKEDIHDMGGASERLLQLRPVTFRYTQPFADGAKPIQYGLIAEEVAEVFPDLAVTGADGQIETVQYQKLDALLLNELQKLYREVQALKAEVARLQQSRGDRK